MENSKPNVIVPYHDPTADDQPSAEQLLDFGNEDAPSLGYDRNLGFDQNAQVPRPSNINPLPNSGQDVVVGSYTLVPISAPVFGPFDTRFASSSRSGPPSTNFMPVPPGQHLADPTNLGASPSNVVPGLNSNVNSGTVVNGVNDPIWDPNFWNFLNDSTIVHQGGHFSGNDGGNCYDNPQGGADFGNPITLPIWPILPSPYSCSGCQTLREIIHTNGVTITNLEIHGRLGTNITHAILDTYDFNYSSENHTYQMFDFSNESIDSIKSFLLQYCEYRRLEGFSLVEDPLTVFFKALLIDIDDVENQIPYLPQPTAMDTDNDTMPQQEVTPSQLNPTSNPTGNVNDNRQQYPASDASGNAIDHRQQNLRQGGRGKSPLAIQRERTKRLKMKDFAKYLHLTIEEAAKKMEVCPTVIKKKCRQAGIGRWPYRKIKGFKRMISIKKQQLANARTDEERNSIKEEIKMYEKAVSDLYLAVLRH